MDSPALDFVPAIASLYEELSKTILVLLRDGKCIIGVLQSYDNFVNLVLENAIDRRVVGDMYSDSKIGYTVVRGDNIVMVAHYDLDAPIQRLRKVSLKVIKEAEAEEGRKRKELLAHKRKIQDGSWFTTGDPFWDGFTGVN